MTTLNKSLLPPVEFLDLLHFTVVAADDPANPIVPSFLTYAEAEAQANELIDLTGVDYIVIDARELEAK